jgi:hypothetical protein
MIFLIIMLSVMHKADGLDDAHAGNGGQKREGQKAGDPILCMVAIVDGKKPYSV